MANNLSVAQKKTGFSLVILAFILILPLIASAGSVPVVPVPTTFIIQSLSNGASYNAYLSTSSTIPFFTETNFQKIMQTDILGSSFCTTGCTISLLPGKFNQTDSINETRPSVQINGSPASVIYPQNIAFHTPFRSVFNFLSPASNFVAQGFKVDDYLRVNQTGVTGDVFTDINGINTCLFNQLTVWNDSSNGFNLGNTNNCIISFNSVVNTPRLCTNLGPHQSCNGNFGILMGSNANGIRVDFNTVSGFNFSDTSGIQNNRGSNIEIGSNEIFGNSFGISTTAGKTLNIHDNKIHDNFAAGVLLTTVGIGTVNSGPVTMSANTITNNAKEPGNDNNCNVGRCPGLMIKGGRPSIGVVSVVANTFNDTQTIMTQFYDIEVATQQVNTLVISANGLGRTASGITLLLTVNPLASWIIQDNPGYNPQPVRGPLTAGASPFTYVNNDAYMEQLAIITLGDTTSLVCRGITQILTAGETTPILNTLDTCVFTYVAMAPTYDVLPLQG